YSGPNTSVTLEINSVFFSWFLPAIAIDDVSFQPCLFSAPPLGDLVGVVHRSCDTLPYTDQPVLDGWSVQLLDSLGNLIGEQVTDSTGGYAFAGLPLGYYIVKTAVQPGWTPNVPATGQVAVSLGGGETVVVDFGFCPSCSCDSIEVIPYQTQGPSDTVSYLLAVSNQSPSCFGYIQIKLDTVGEFIGWDSLQPGWTAELLNSKLIELRWTEPLLPAGSYIPIWLKAQGAGEQHLTVTSFWNDGSTDVPCTRSFGAYPVPTPQSGCCSDPGANNLLPNPDFSQGNTGFSSDYGSDCSNALPGHYCVSGNPNNVNNNFSACSDYTTGSGLMLVANGSLQSSKRVWYKTVPVTPNTDYKFVFHYTPLNNNNKPTLGASINNFNVNTSGFIGGVCDWWGLCVATWNSGGNTSATLAIRDLTTNANGNDFALDGMWFFPCPSFCIASFSDTPLDNCGKYQFTSTSINPPANAQYCWNFDNNLATCESTAASPMWQFPTCGAYSVSLKLTGSNCWSAAVQTITVTDNTPPTAICAPGAGYDMGNSCTLNVTPAMIDGGSFDNCQIASTSVNPTQVPCGFSTVTLTVTDWCGNTSSCVTDIQAFEGIPPTALCQPSMAIDVGNACSLALTPSMIDAGSYDNCPNISTSIDPALITCGTTTVTLTVTDHCGNTGTCTTDISIGEGQAPMITCPFGLSANCNLNVGPDVAGVATAVDNCTPAIKIEYTYSDVVFGMPGCDDYIERTWVAEDLCGNTSSCVQVISVKDNIPPDITNCPQSQSVGMDPGQCHYTFVPPSLTVTDNCDPSPSLSCTWEDPNGTIWPLTGSEQLPKGITTIRCKATDDCGNESPWCIYTIQVADTEQPTLFCPPNITVQSTYNSAGQCEAIVGNLAPTTSDNCPIISIDYLVSPLGATGQNDASGTLFNGVSTLSYTLLDCGGFVKTCSTTVTVACPPCTPVAGAACADTVNVNVQCIPNVFGQYDLSFQTLNQSGFSADRIELTAVTPFGGIGQTVFNVALPNNSTSGTILTTLYGVPGATVCFKISLYRTAPNGVVLECCETAQICVTLPECPGTCNCLGADNLSFTYTGFTPNVSWAAPVPAVCGDPNPVILPCVPVGETPFAFHGVAHCDAADCIFSNFDWDVLDASGAVVLPGGPTTFSAIIGPDAYFDIYNLSSNSLTPNVTYTLKVTWYCGGKICTCEVKFQLSVCDCQCFNPVSNVAITSGTLTLSAPCGSTLFQGIPCPPAGNFVKVTGKFQCVGTECLPGKIVKYTLTGPNGPVTSGAVLATPFFSINLLPQQMYAVGQYTLTMTGECNGQPCTPCFFKFFHQCPEPCPCPDATFNNLVDQGFTVSSSGTACKACFTPKNLGPCEKVEWFVNGIGPLGSPTMGNAPFCHTFSNTNTYQVRMDVTRYKTDGSVCATRSKTQYVKILCDPTNSPCSADVVTNPGFDQGAVTGGLNSGGVTSGWQGVYGDPVVKEGFGASDGWSVMLSGNRESADVLSPLIATCWVKDTGTISLRIHSWPNDPNGNNPVFAAKPGETLMLRLYRGAIQNPFTDTCDGSNCLVLLEQLPESPDSSEWYHLEIPYNLSDWAATDSCGNPLPDPQGVLVRPVLYVTNWLGSESGEASETRSMVLVDNFCIDGVLVGTESPFQKGRIRLFPNPNDGAFTVELPEPAAPGMRLRVIGLTGQLCWERAAEAGSTLQTVQVSELPSGLYFLQLVSRGKPTATVRFVRQ
ncbi:MAG: T9SS type A sorting domain-containing protein, partial [Saprospiraceae bacterium]|nr:T9SS type A sorting domain-containing protein [Saprospiraceae bacterium]